MKFKITKEEYEKIRREHEEFHRRVEDEIYSKTQYYDDYPKISRFTSITFSLLFFSSMILLTFSFIRAVTSAATSKQRRSPYNSTIYYPEDNDPVLDELKRHQRNIYDLRTERRLQDYYRSRREIKDEVNK